MNHLLRPPGPQHEYWDWQRGAACRGMDTNLFFPAAGERGQDREAREQAARRVCARCPVRRPCAQFALRAHEQYGVWGGLTEEDRRKRR
jgi:WhiB family redox-sensing transcriptional regulator